jgi:biotin transport system substrate-specific component
MSDSRNQPTSTAASVAVADRSDANELLRQLAFALVFAGLTALSAQVTLFKWPVPFTGQVLVVLLAGAIGGPRAGLMSQIIYLAAGGAGVPVFAEYKGGLAVLLGPTGGYLLAYPIVAYLAGRGARFGKFMPLLLTLLGCAALNLAIGGTWLAVWSLQTGAEHSGFDYAFVHGVAPFMGIDAAKAIVAGVVAWPFVRRRAPEQG